MADILQTLTSGVLAGSIYVLIALGFTLVFGVMRVINFAHGELVMVGMYVSFVVWSVFGLDPYLALPVVIVVMVLISGVMFEAAIRPILSAPHFNQLVITFGLLILLQSVVLLQFGGNLRTVNVAYGNAVLQIGPVVVSVPRLYAAIAAWVVTLGVYLYLERTASGRAVRACAQDEIGYAVVGGNVRRVQRLAFVMSGVLAGMAGVFLTSFSVLSPFVGVEFTIKAFLIVMLGGLGRVQGTLVAGLLFGIAEGFAARAVAPGLAVSVTYALVIALIVWRPRGLLAGSAA